ncbi:MAG: MFS transporter [Pseudomonadales bacterium]|nr:MFS transporter [Pseudomonadales bacterium]
MPVSSQSKPANHSPFSLFRSLRFRPFFFTQFLGAFNDNLYKNSLILMITFQLLHLDQGTINQLVNLAALLFILPFFLFSALAGQLADKYEKSRLIRIIKLIEIGLMTGGAFAFWQQSLTSLLFLLFLLGSQSSFFGPIKYSIIPQHIEPQKLVQANALIEMGTFVSILLGTLAALASQSSAEHLLIPFAIILFAVLGWVASLKIPPAQPPNPTLQINWNLFQQSLKCIQYAREDKSVFIAIIGISWFWFIGVSYLTQFPNFCKTHLQAEAAVVSLLLAVFSIGIAIGSLLCARLCAKKLELGLVPVACLGLMTFGLDLSFAYTPVSPTVNPAIPLSISNFLNQLQGLHVLLDIMLIGLFGGLYIVPLYTLVQQRAEPNYLSQVIASNNIINSLFMVAAAGFGLLLLGKIEMSMAEFFQILALSNIAAGTYLCHQNPEFMQGLMNPFRQQI